MTKQCNKCKEIKNVSNFYKRGDRTDGYKYICKVCDNILSNERSKKIDWKNAKKRQGKGTKHSKMSKINSQRHRTEMSDMYIRSLITKKSKNLKSEDIPNKLVEFHRATLKIKRKLDLTNKPE